MNQIPYQIFYQILKKSMKFRTQSFRIPLQINSIPCHTHQKTFETQLNSLFNLIEIEYNIYQIIMKSITALTKSQGKQLKSLPNSLPNLEEITLFFHSILQSFFINQLNSVTNPQNFLTNPSNFLTNPLEINSSPYQILGPKDIG